ncbi:MAG: 2-oxoacid:acceptor oxidoreductase subunit alpha [Pseudodesulfovibrio sp.]|uniref:Pyruvate flavodoxin/ferredoxin oxidoreductase domain protein n=1 Tax=Pseudodesulfovibrio aespoeensis (strain ATCC 700646 / DSM 10631 / Aspo-2) TaxID=643562 RepID=E6VS51_PSEA9|nr:MULTISPECIES: 2-oxoacid:acceptor oxidoreductase subunit alpha [Pseudodesulfovibrio]MBU4191032.1 2-oxoacid:acceptor oxidoreductase subunit alpha [Pseudomonadota bacterium]ADU63096.1 pyruvate flavodoxin/ferredoxin oxidoreductase domain protein [Pseudodesulfovibrio aespoeensis Aspo-2]MBU4243201.1 2-oxoacid:acceptor oxidoreductase subunit alpha [Pseudomonadota bacterium]MBU4379629.1 2-oxoacid:acceptor oxidoreductase subunit alpha [Pseudomonadota bacterium]MBU4474128.1 2-oxoacid:acceptor oxidore
MARPRKRKEIFALGNEAVVEGALLAGCSFFGGYPITPSSEIMEIMAARLPRIKDGVFLQLEDEIASMGAIVGASLAGRKVLTATSGPGFSLMQENLGYAIMAETPLVLVNVMRGGPSTGLPTSPAQGDVQQARWGTHGDHPIIVLSASNVQECLSMTITAFNMAEKYRTPVILLLDEVTAHTREKIQIPNPGEYEVFSRAVPSMPPEWYKPYEETVRGVPPMPPIGSGYRFHVTGLIHDRNGFPTQRPEEVVELLERLHRKIDQFFYDIQLVDTIETDDADVVVIAYGSVARSAELAVRQARESGVKAGLLKLKTLFPYPRRQTEKVLAHARTLVVPEMNMGQMSREVKRVNMGRAAVRTINRIDGQIVTPSEILKVIMQG